MNGVASVNIPFPITIETDSSFNTFKRTYCSSFLSRTHTSKLVVLDVGNIDTKAGNTRQIFPYLSRIRPKGGRAVIYVICLNIQYTSDSMIGSGVRVGNSAKAFTILLPVQLSDCALRILLQGAKYTFNSSLRFVS